MKIISIDPGRTTGYCYAELDEVQHQMVYCPFQMVDDVDEFWHRLFKFAPKYVIIEDFEFRRGKAGVAGLDLFPVQLIGVARLYELLAKGPDLPRLFIQKASTGKAYYTDNVLKGQGLYKRALPHGMDASRHLLQWLTFGFGNQFIGTRQDFARLVELEHFAS